MNPVKRTCNNKIFKSSIVLLLLIILTIPLNAQTKIVGTNGEAKTALLIANEKYDHFGSLGTPVKEAEDLQRSLESIGFKVTLLENASREEILDELSNFEKELKKCGGIAFFSLRRTRGSSKWKELPDSCRC